MNVKTEPPRTSRIKHIDAAKGILMLLVVLGHSQFTHSVYIYWFHIPAFFIISGYLHRQPESQLVKEVILTKSKRLFFSYFAFGMLIAAVIAVGELIYGGAHPLKNLLVNTGRVFFGGKALFSALGPLWFINCYILTTALFTLLLNRAKRNLAAIAFSIIFYAIGIVLCKYTSFMYPWSINLVPVAMGLYAIGYFGKSILSHFLFINQQTLLVYAVSLLLCAALVYAYNKSFFYFYLDMKIGYFSNPFFLLVICPFLTANLLYTSLLLERMRLAGWLAYIGKHTLIIMCLHRGLALMVQSFTGKSLPYIVFVGVGVGGSIIIGEVLRQFAFTNKYFLGNRSKRLHTSAIKQSLPVVN